MKKVMKFLENLVGFVSLISIIGIIVFGFIDNFSMFFLSTSLALMSLPWVFGVNNKQGLRIERYIENTDKSSILLNKFVSKSLIPLLFIGWLYLLNRFVELPTIAFYIELIWAFYMIVTLIIYVYEYFKSKKTIK